nr:hypothetical protein [uncultured Desulfuromonas sp.]
MAFFFPDEAQRPHYRQLYGRLSAVERGMVLREFVGVTYRRRFHFFAETAMPIRNRPSSTISKKRLAVSTVVFAFPDASGAKVPLFAPTCR